MLQRIQNDKYAVASYLNNVLILKIAAHGAVVYFWIQFAYICVMETGMKSVIFLSVIAFYIYPGVMFETQKLEDILFRYQQLCYRLIR